MTTAPALAAGLAGARAVAPVPLAQSIRRHNRGVVLRTLLRETTASRADLSRLTGLARPTISEVVRDLLADGVILETGHRSASRPGKPAVMLEVDPDAVQAVAIDLSDPGRIRAAVCAPDGRILHRTATPRRAGDTAAELASDLGTLVAGLAARTAHPVLGVGIGLPVGDAAADGLSAALLTTDLGGLPVHVAAEADLAARAERDAGTHGTDFLLVRIGTGVSTAIVAEYAGDGLGVTGPGAKELAHIDVGGTAGEPCRCGSEGCVHAWVGAPALDRRIAAAGDDHARQAVRAEAGQRLGLPLAAIVSALDLPRVVLSGPETVADETFRTALEDSLAAIAQLPHARVDVHRGTVTDAVLRGAAAHVVSAELV
ncbi:ROK family transcriptional regulator [Streptomyces sp. MS2A]|nr:ROK family transcriptional regulator [Streptomyces sp. MS2A]